MEVSQYHYLRECELDAALAQSQADVAAGRYVVESAQQHMARLDALLATDAPAEPGLKRAASRTAAAKPASAKKASRQRRAG